MDSSESPENNYQMVMDRLNHLEQENSLLRQTLHSRPATPLLATVAPASAVQERLPEPRIATPEKFNGDRKDFRHFINHLELMFLLNPSRYSNDGLKVGTAASYCTSNAAAWINSYLEHASEHYELLNNWSMFKEAFRKAFSPVDPATIAANVQLEKLIKYT
jgi:hypothetical protein